MTLDLPPLTAMDAEHQAWLSFCEQLRSLGIDINEQDALHATVTMWGEELHRLRNAHEGKYDESAYADAVERYRTHVGPRGW